MGYFNSEPPYKHGDPPRIGIILANLGTPDAPNALSLRRYLGQFLMDRRVVEIPRFIWCWILHFIILVFRPKASAKKTTPKKKAAAKKATAKKATAKKASAKKAAKK